MEFRQLRWTCLWVGALVTLVPWKILGQSGGRYPFELVSTSGDPLSLSQGGFAPVWGTSGPLSILANPALLEPNRTASYAASWVQRPAGLGQGEAAWVRPSSQESSWALALGARWSRTGSMPRTNPFGQLEGEHRAGEGALLVQVAHRMNPRWNWGLQGRLISSQLSGYNAWGGGLSMALRYQDPDQKRAVSFLVDDIQVLFKDYLPGMATRSLVPRRVSLLTTQALAHLPLRWTLGLQHLENWSLRYRDPKDPYQTRIFSLNGADTTKESALAGAGRELLLHVVLGSELNLGKYLRLRVGYQALNRAEWSFPERTGGSGFRWGLGIESRRYRLEFTSFPQTFAARSTAFSLTLQP